MNPLLTITPRQHLVAPAMLVILSAIDLITTDRVLAAGGAEASPFVSPWIENWWAVFIKIGIVAAILLVSFRWPERLTVRTFTLAWIVVGFYISTIGFNIAVWAQLVA